MARFHIYIKDKQFFDKICKSVQTLWYSRYGVSLTKGSVILKALILTESELLGDTEDKNDSKRQALYKYKRVGL